MKEPIWLQQNVVLAFHEMLLAQHGGLAGLRDIGLLESALARPINQFLYEKSTPSKIAAAYAYGLIRNHPFADGNKRVAFVAMKTFLLRNGVSLKYSKEEAIFTFLKLAADELSEESLADWIEDHMVSVSRPEVETHFQASLKKNRRLGKLLGK